MKRLVVGLALILTAAAIFAQNDLQPLAVVKLNKSETITLKMLKTRTDIYQKQSGSQTPFTVEQKKEILNALIDEKLVVQAAQKEGLVITDSQVSQAFVQSLSQQVGQQVTEQQFAEIVKQQTNMTFDEFMVQQVGMTVSEYKTYLKSQLTAQQYIMAKKQAEMQKIAATDDEVRSFFEMNKASFVQNDLLKLYLVIVPKGTDSVGARATATDLSNKYNNKTLTGDQIKNSKDNGTVYQAGELLVQKTAQHAQQLGITYNQLIELFQKDIGFTSELVETDTDYQFYSVLKKYDAKMLGLSDIVQPDTTITVYDYIRSNLTQQKQSAFLVQAIDDLSKELDVPANVDRKKTGDALDKLLNW